MILLIHKNSESIVEVVKDREPIEISSKTCTDAAWEMAKKFPEEVIGWCEISFRHQIAEEDWKYIFHHQLIMASYAIKSSFFPPSLGYVDQLPFINVNREVKYPTWQMSTDIGGIYGKTLLRFKDIFSEISDFGYLLNSIAKIGQQNGLFCYSDPTLTKAAINLKPAPAASMQELFSFVHQHYTLSWTSILLWCLWNYENKFCISNYLQSFFKKRNFRREVDLSELQPDTIQKENTGISIDVIIPTLGRKIYLEQVLEDLKGQILKPQNVIIIEQNADPNSESELNVMISKDWRFKIIHHFTHQTGACNARNIALQEVKSEWIFFADDDIRLQPELLRDVKEETEKYQIPALNLNCKQAGEETVFYKVKQWGSFGAGTSVVKSEYAKKCNFSAVFEFGFGEDADFGMQLRNNGCDIIYHPSLEIFHLKAPVGGFRKKPEVPWEQEGLLPKPSPTVMAFALKYYSPEQINGYKVSLFLKYYRHQEIKNPLRYLRSLRKRWQLSEEWARRLLQKDAAVVGPKSTGP